MSKHTDEEIQKIIDWAVDELVYEEFRQRVLYGKDVPTQEWHLNK